MGNVPSIRQSFYHSKSGRNLNKTQLVVMTDAGQDCDDEAALLLSIELIKMGEIDPDMTIIANLHPAADRARLVQGALNVLFEKNEKYLPPHTSSRTVVAVGTDGGDKQGKHQNKFLETGKDYVISEEITISGNQAMLNAYEKADKENTDNRPSITLLCISSLTDAGDFVSNHPDLFARNTKEVVLMGGGLVVDGKLVPEKDAHNCAFDMAASTKLFEVCQTKKVPMVIFSRHASLAVQFPPSLYDNLADTGNPVALRLRNTQKHDLDLLWRRSIATTDEERQGLPARCDRAWYLKTFCGGEDVVVDDNEIWKSVNKLSISDLAAMLASVPFYRDKFFIWNEVVVDGVVHKLIGTSPENRCVVDADGYINFVTKALISVCSGSEPSGMRTLGTKKKSLISFS